MRSYKTIAGNDAVIFDRIQGGGYVEVEQVEARRLDIRAYDTKRGASYLLSPRQAEQLGTVLLAWAKGEDEALRRSLLEEMETSALKC